jgi:transcriptional regulator with XRE-family HTH domain
MISSCKDEKTFAMIEGKRLRQIREAHGYSRREVAEKIGIAESQIVRYENGENDASGDVLARFAQFFGVSSDYLLGLTEISLLNSERDLQPDEIALIAARRRGDLREAIKLLVPED